MRRLVCENYPVDRLPRDLHPGLPSGRRVRIIIEDEITDEELREEIDRELRKGLKSLDEGRSQTSAEVLARIDARFAKAPAAE